MQRIITLLVVILCLAFTKVLAQRDTIDFENFKSVQSGDVFSAPIKVSFLKYKSDQSADSSYFNTIIISNRNNYAVKGQLKLAYPKNWILLIPPPENIQIEANDSIILPLMVMLPKTMVGGTANAINASFTVNGKKYSGNAYVRAPRSRNWFFEVESQDLVFNEYIETVTNNIYIKNNGNSPELIKLSIETGLMLKIDEFPMEKHEMYVTVAPKQDTTIYFKVRRASVSSNVKGIYKDNAKASSIKITANTDDKNRSVVIYSRELESRFDGMDNKLLAPLNINLNISNIMGNGIPITSSFVYGGIFFNNNQDLQYNLILRNLSPNNWSNFNFNNSIYGRVSYNNSFLRLSAGDGIGLPLIHSARGFGASGVVSINSKLKVGAAITRQRFNNNQAASIYADAKILKHVPLKVGYTVEINDQLGLITNSIQAGSALKILNNTLGGNICISQFNLNANPALSVSADSSFRGFSYNLSHNFSYKSFKTRTIVTDNANNLLNFSSSRLIDHTTTYLLKNRQQLVFRARLTDLNENNGAVRILYGKGGSRFQDVYNVFYSSAVKGGGNINIGPQYTVFGADIYNRTSTIQFSTFSRFYGLATSYRKPTTTHKTLGVSSYIGVTDYNIKDLGSSNRFNQFSFRLSGNYYSRDWRFSIIYTYGPYNEGAYVANLNNGSSIFQSLAFRPYYEASYWDNRIKLSVQALYSLLIPSGQELLTANVRVTGDIGKGWFLYGSGNYYSSSRPDETTGSQRFKSVGLNVGVQKAFGLQQPRIKYYDLQIVCFHDLNGNGTLDDDELKLTNIMVKVKGNNEELKLKKVGFVEQNLMTNSTGTVSLNDIPACTYELEFTSLENLGNLYNVLGSLRSIDLTKNTILYVPFAEAYKVYGKVVVNRDKFSALGKIDIGNIRITGKSPTGYGYSTLTAGDGSFQLDIPQAGFYEVSISNVLGPNFELEANDFLVDFNGFKTYELNFTFNELKRKVNFDGPNLFDFENSPTNADSAAIAENSPDESEASTEETAENTKPKEKEVQTRVNQFSGSSVPYNPNGTSQTNNSASGGNNASGGGKSAGNMSAQDMEIAEYAALEKVLDRLLQKLDKMSPDLASNSDGNYKPQNGQQYSPDSPEFKYADEFPSETPGSADELPSKIDPDKVKFKVQTGIFSKPIPERLHDKLIALGFKATKTSYGMIRYTSGAFATYEEAKAHKLELTELGYEGVFIVSFYDNIYIPAKKGIELLAK